MPTESESQRVERIQNDQISSRTRSQSHTKGRNATASSKTKSSPKSVSHTAPKSKRKVGYPDNAGTLKDKFLGTFSTGVQDIVVGVAVGIIPAFLAMMFLPGVFKFVGILILLIAAGTGYMLGNATD